jgi:hypothetical protein
VPRIVRSLRQKILKFFGFNKCGRHNKHQATWLTSRIIAKSIAPPAPQRTAGWRPGAGNTGGNLPRHGLCKRPADPRPLPRECPRGALLPTSPAEPNCRHYGVPPPLQLMGGPVFMMVHLPKGSLNRATTSSCDAFNVPCWDSQEPAETPQDPMIALQS